MQALSGKRCRALGLALVLVGASGCVEFGMDIPQLWQTKKSKQKAADLAKYGPTAKEKIAKLKSLRENANSYSPSDKSQIAADLAKEIQNESNTSVRKHILLTLGSYPGDDAAAALRLSLRDSDADVRVAACAGLAKYNGTDSTKMLSQTLADDSSIDVRLAAAKALGMKREPAAIAALGTALEDGDPAIQYRAMASMKESSGKNFGNDVNAWRQYARSVAPAGSMTPDGKQESIASGQQNKPF